MSLTRSSSYSLAVTRMRGLKPWHVVTTCYIDRRGEKKTHTISSLSRCFEVQRQMRSCWFIANSARGSWFQIYRVISFFWLFFFFAIEWTFVRLSFLLFSFVSCIYCYRRDKLEWNYQLPLLSTIHCYCKLLKRCFKYITKYWNWSKSRKTYIYLNYFSLLFRMDLFTFLLFRSSAV